MRVHVLLLALGSALCLTTPAVLAQTPTPPSPLWRMIDCGQVISGSIDRPGEADLFRFRGDAGDVVEITLVGSAPGGHQLATVFDPDNQIVLSFYSDDLRDLVLPKSGRYTIRITSWDLVFTGPYHVGRSCRAPLGPVIADLACGDVVTSEISRAAEVDYFTFDGAAGDVVELTLVGTFPGGYQCATVFAPSGAMIAAFCGDTLQELVLTETGQHAVRVISYDFAFVGPYHLGLSCRDPLGPVVADLGCGSLVTTEISRPAEVDYFTFTGQAGQHVAITLVGTQPGGDKCARVFSPSGAWVEFCSDTLEDLVLAESGQYAVRVISYDLVLEGDYHVGLSCP